MSILMTTCTIISDKFEDHYFRSMMPTDRISMEVKVLAMTTASVNVRPV